MDKETLNGKLYIVSTPIGNLEDITLRALRILKEVDLIAAEDTRHTRKLLAHYEISTRLISYHSHNEHRRVSELIEQILAGSKIAVVSDAGTPGIADPGFLLVREAFRNGITPEIIPGVSALTFAATASGLPIDRLAFYGFLPIKSGRRGSALELVCREDKTVIIYESPHRMNKLIMELAERLKPETPLAIIREATKLHEEILSGTTAEIMELTKDRAWKGECVVLVSPQHGDNSKAFPPKTIENN
ncbi:MAG: 16S rRNA (cytidine(1402)-2'-O)-methyltransferase [Victivallaceae bacterium]|nr:16S rRNA (cytidine(1402)-2'-O)-methyltransferase [Victivallaceae bacterium]MDD4180528.1 16S rRNA (cytidine(1402)-2'-O)-methyltransferase [Victivallaceae bacterium]